MRRHKRKEKVIHTRITDNLNEKIRKEAIESGISVSNLVRNILFNAFDLVEDIVTDSANIAKSVRTNSCWYDKEKENTSEVIDPQIRPYPQGAIIGWREMILNLNAVCHKCNDILPKGASAAIAEIEGVGSRPVICQKCLKELMGISGNDITNGEGNEA